MILKGNAKVLEIIRCLFGGNARLKILRSLLHESSSLSSGTRKKKGVGHIGCPFLFRFRQKTAQLADGVINLR
jgi:hypothetical protein